MDELARFLWYPTQMPAYPPMNFRSFYEAFNEPIGNFDCGKKCAPYNEKLVPFCCDTYHIVPTAYHSEWEYLKNHTNLWHTWRSRAADEAEELRQQAPSDQVLIECLGHKLCQRTFRTIACRAFPFFPYIDHNEKYVGISYYVEYSELCWVISNLDYVTPAYCQAFHDAYMQIFKYFPDEKDNFNYYSSQLRIRQQRKDLSITILDEQGVIYIISPTSGRKRKSTSEDLPKFGNYEIADMLPFPDEID